MKQKVYIKRLDPSVPAPAYAHDDDAGFDLFARSEVVLGPGERAQVPTGVAMVIPDGYVGLVWDKSGISHKHGLKTLGGVVDAGYRGEVMVGVVNVGSEPYHIDKHRKVAQMLVQAVEHVVFEEVEELPDSVRGTGGFGSTGV
jgi:dUTP pyrophosphatase